MSPWDIVALVLGLGLVLVPMTWKHVTHAITLVHELGHALVGLITGAQVSSIKINKDSSGVTTSAHPLKNIALTRTFTTFWGYPFPPLVAGALTSLAYTIGVEWAWWAVLILGIICLLFIRNLFGFMITAIWIAMSSALLWFPINDYLLHAGLWLLTAVLFFGGIRDFVNLTRIHRSHKDDSSDIQALKQITHIPAAIWLGLMWLTGCVFVPYLVWWILLR